MPSLAQAAASKTAEVPDAERLEALLALAGEFAHGFESREGLRAAGEALRLARRLENVEAEARALSYATLCHYHRGDYVAAVATGLDACATFSDHDLRGRSHALQGVALSFFSVGEFRRAEQAARQAIAAARADGEARHEATSLNVLGYVLADDGRYEAALVAFRQARGRFKSLGDTVRVKKATSNAGHAWRKRGHALFAARDHEGARGCWRRAMRYYRSALKAGRSRLDDAIILGSLGECTLHLGHPHEALSHLSAAAQRTGPRDALRIVAHIELQRGEACRAVHRWAEAERHLRAAVEGAEALENEELAVDARLGLAKLAEDRGQAAEARQWRDAARKLRESRREALAAFRREMRPLWDRHFRDGH